MISDGRIEVADRPAQARTFAACSDETIPSPSSRALPPGPAPPPDRNVASTPLASTISSRWPSSPKPVTSVAACTSWRASTSAAAGWRLAYAPAPPSASAPWPCRACRRRAACRCRPASPGSARRRAGALPLRSAYPRPTRPLTAKPSASSGPSLVCPPTSAQPASTTPRWRPSSIRRGRPRPCPRARTAAWRSPAPSAARPPWHRCRPAHGWRRSGRTRTGRRRTPGNNRRSAPTACRPPISTTAASSGASRPTTTSRRAAGQICPSARTSTPAPTLAPHPRQRMAGPRSPAAPPCRPAAARNAGRHHRQLGEPLMKVGRCGPSSARPSRRRPEAVA